MSPETVKHNRLRLAALPLSLWLGCVAESDAARLAGTWRPQDQLGTGTTELVLSADGSVVVDVTSVLGHRTVSRGGFTVSGDQITLDITDPDGGRTRLVNSFHLGQGLLLPTAYLPMGAHKGAVGTWVATVQTTPLDAQGAPLSAAQTSSYSYELRQDRTVKTEIAQAGFEKTEQSGTYREEAPGRLVLEFKTGAVTSTARLALVDDAAMGQPFLRVTQ